MRAPYLCPMSTIERFIADHQKWLEKRLASFRTYTDEEIKAMRKEAKAYFPERVAYYALRMGVSPSGVKITAARTRYGSCSPTGSLCFSLYLMDKSPYARDYVVVHELAHLLRRDHSPSFYKIIEKTLPDYKQRIKELKQ